MKTLVSSGALASATAFAPSRPWRSEVASEVVAPDRSRGASEALTAVLAARQHAESVLDSLLVACVHLESRQREGGRHDPIKVVTGLSSIETAIASTRAMIATLDRLVRS